MLSTVSFTSWIFKQQTIRKSITRHKQENNLTMFTAVVCLEQMPLEHFQLQDRCPEHNSFTRHVR